LDIALVSDTSSSTSGPFSGKLTLLVNDGQGGFTVAPSPQVLNFAPSSVATSSRLSQARRPDLLIRDANASRFLFLINTGSGTFRLPTGPSQGSFGGPGHLH